MYWLRNSLNILLKDLIYLLLDKEYLHILLEFKPIVTLQLIRIELIAFIKILIKIKLNMIFTL